MNTTNRKLWITTALVFCSSTNADESGALMRTAVAGLIVDKSRYGFEEDDDRRVFERGDQQPTEWARGPVFLTDHLSNHSVMIHLFWKLGSPYYYMIVGLDSEIEPTDLEGEWRLLVERAASIVTAVQPDFAVGFAKPPHLASDPVNYGAMCTAGAAQVLTPWTYFGSRIAEVDARQRLANLPGVSAQSIADGLMIDVVKIPGTSPDPRFIRALRSIGNIDYIDPLLPTPEA